MFIFGVLGHVCPVAYLGMSNAAIIGYLAFRNKSPHFIGLLFSWIIAGIGWAFSFFVLHPFDSHNLSRIVNVEPFLVLIITTVACTVGIGIFNKDYKIPNWVIIVFQILERILMIIGLLVSIGFLSIRSFRDSMFEESTDWFDTVFYNYDVYNLFLFLSVILLISSISSLLGWILKNKLDKNNLLRLRLFGQTFFGMLLIGSIISLMILNGNDNIRK
jgi:hypothetical protein